MKSICLALALASAVVIPQISHGQYADVVISYNPGTGASSSYTNNPGAALGAPALGNSVTPFDPPYTPSQIVGLGAGGEITLQMSTPIVNNPSDPYGINFILFANTLFVEGAGGVATGLYDHNPSMSVQVSSDGSTWYTLNPALAPEAGTLYPTSGSGNPQIAVNPSLTLGSFLGQNLAGINSLYNGSAGGTGYDLAWAQDANDNSVNLPSVDYIQIDVQNGLLYLDAASEVQAVPEPKTWTLVLASAGLFWVFPHIKRSCLMKIMTLALALAGLMFGSSGIAATITEDFATNPLQNGWQIFGDANLFQWNSTNQNLQVTWDSSQSNSYFYIPLGTVLTRSNDFSISFDLELSNATASGYGFELALGFFNLADATSTNFQRSTGVDSPNLVEFDYFPPTDTYFDIAATVWPTFVDSNSTFNYNGPVDYSLYQPSNSDWYHVVMTYSAWNQALVTTMTNFEQTTGITIVDTFSTNFTDFQVDTFSISSYHDDGLGDSIYAQGAVANINITLPPPPLEQIPNVALNQNFSANPLRNGWQTFGNSNLFQWDSTNQNLQVTWDSSQSNSYFYVPLGTILTREDDFRISFDLELSNAQASGYGFELALGFFNLADATSTNFQRSTGVNSPNLVEFDYFPPADTYFDIAATVWPTFVDSNSTFNYNGPIDYSLYQPSNSDWYHVVMTYSAWNQALVTTLTNFEQTTGVTVFDTFSTNFTDYRVDTFSISSYQDDGLGDSIYAQGVVANINILLPPPSIQNLTGVLTNGLWQAQFCSQSNWLYELQRTCNFQAWTNVSPVTAGNATNLILLDTNPPPNQAFYRVNAFKP